VNGSSRLTPEQQEFYTGRYGERYLAVQENHVRPSRRVRRAKAGKRHALTQRDFDALEVQRKMIETLQATTIKPVI
jgi:hypothetical protein